MKACPPLEELTLLVENRLDQTDLGAIAVHVETCARCQQLLEQLTGAAPVVAASDSAPLKNDDDAEMLARIRAKWPTAAPEEQFDQVRSDSSASPVMNGISPTDVITTCSHSKEPFPAIAGFRILREIGRGGMGIVYLAEQGQLNRTVALKILRSDMFRDQRQIQRFEREVRAAGRLHHTNIVPVFGAGEEGGHPYYVMQYIDGKGLHAVVADLRRRELEHTEPRGHDATTSTSSSRASDSVGHARSPSRTGAHWKNVARIGLQVADALEYANRQGVLHRDIKPSNLLVDEDGTVWVTDFGLAKTMDDDDLTSTGDVVGTLRYMAPERFQGRSDATADIYSLGLTLYELAALRPAYPQTDRIELFDKVRSAELMRLRSLAPRIPRDFETIIHKAVDRSTAKRYQSAAALADDLRRFLDGWPILARRVSPAERVIRWCRHNPWATATVAILLLAALASSILAYRATRAERAARTDRDRVLAANSTLLHNEIDSLLNEEMRPYRKALVTEGLRQAKELVAELEGDPRAMPQLVKAYFALAKNQAESGDLPAARATMDEGLKLARAMVDRDGSSATAQQALADTLHQAVLLAPNAALKLERANQSNALYKKLLEASPTATESLHWACQVALNDHNIGGLYYTEGGSAIGPSNERSMQNAIDAFLEGKRFCDERIHRGDDREVVFLRLAPIERYLCRAYRYQAALAKEPKDATRALSESIEAGKRAVLAFQKLVSMGPDNFQYELDLGSGHDELGQSYRQLGEMGFAAEALESGRRSLQKLLDRYGSVVSRVVLLKDLLCTSDYNLIEVYETDPVGHAARIRELVNEEFEISEKLDVVIKLSLNMRIVHAFACAAMAEYQEDDNKQADPALMLKSAHLFEELHALLPDDSTYAGMLRISQQGLADLLSGQGDLAEAARWRDRCLKIGRGKPGLLYDIALNFALRSNLVGKRPTKLDRGQLAARQRRYDHHAIVTLREAVAAGFKDARRVRNEIAFIGMRSHPDFQMILFDIEFPADALLRNEKQK